MLRQGVVHVLALQDAKSLTPTRWVAVCVCVCVHYPLQLETASIGLLVAECSLHSVHDMLRTTCTTLLCCLASI